MHNKTFSPPSSVGGEAESPTVSGQLASIKQLWNHITKQMQCTELATYAIVQLRARQPLHAFTSNRKQGRNILLTQIYMYILSDATAAVPFFGQINRKKSGRKQT